MFHRKPVLFIHAVTNADGRRSLKIFMAPLWVKPSANAHKNWTLPLLFMCMAMPPLQSSTGILPRYAVIMGRLNTRQAAKARCGRRYQTQDGESFMSTTPVQPKPALEKAIKLCSSGYGADEHSAPVKSSSGQLIAFIRYPFCRNIPFIIHLQ